MSYEEVFRGVLFSLDNYDVTKFKNLSDMLDLHNDRMELDKLKNIYRDYISLCNSPEFSRIKQKYCI